MALPSEEELRMNEMPDLDDIERKYMTPTITPYTLRILRIRLPHFLGVVLGISSLFAALINHPRRTPAAPSLAATPHSTSTFLQQYTIPLHSLHCRPLISYTRRIYYHQQARLLHSRFSATSLVAANVAQHPCLCFIASSTWTKGIARTKPARYIQRLIRP